MGNMEVKMVETAAGFSSEADGAMNDKIPNEGFLTEMATHL